MDARLWTLDADEIVALPLDELALLVLQDAQANQAWNWKNWMNAAKRHSYPKRPDALQALAEAWSWLHSRGLIVFWHSTQSADSSITITQRGQQLLETGLIWLRAVERLDVDLVPAP